MKPYFAAIALAIGFTTVSNASVTLVFSQPFAGGIASNFANAAGVATDGMRWGIVVDTTGNGFSNSGTSYNNYAAGVTTAGFFSANGSVTDDYFIPGAQTGQPNAQTSDSSTNQEGDFATFGGHGTIFNTGGIPLFNSNAALNDPGGVAATGEKFALIWFSSSTSAAGDKYGFFTDASFTLPTTGTSGGGYDAVFTGPDPIRTASNTFAPLSVPEPSRVLLLGFGALGLVARRRRSVKLA